MSIDALKLKLSPWCRKVVVITTAQLYLIVSERTFSGQSSGWREPTVKVPLLYWFTISRQKTKVRIISITITIISFQIVFKILCDKSRFIQFSFCYKNNYTSAAH